MHLALRLIFATVGASFSIAASSAPAPKCPINDTATRSFLGNMLAALERPPPTVSCDSLRSVLAKWAKRKQTGGRKLENDKPFDERRARADMDAAMRDPAISARLKTVRSEVSDASLRLIYEAAILDDEGHYSARELVLRQLQN